MELDPIYDCVAGLDVHLAKVVVCVVRKLQNGEIESLVKEFGGFKRDRYAMAQWVASFAPQAVSMESTGIYWKSPYAALERVGIRAKVVNAQHVAKVEGRKTDICDAQWLAMLTRAGLLRSSFIPHENVRHLRLLARYHTSLTQMLGSEKNRLLKILGDGGMRLSALVSDPHGVACRQMLRKLLEGASPEQAVLHAGRLRAKRSELCASLDHELTPTHVYVAQQILENIDTLEARLAKLQAHLLQQLQPLTAVIERLLTLPGVDRLGAAKLLVETGAQMSHFGSPGRLAAWCGVCPGNHQTADKRKHVRTRKGNPHVRRLLIECANAAVKSRCYFREKYQSLRSRLGHKKSIVAIAHKMIKVFYCMLTRKEYYQDRSADFEELRTRRNAPRWLRNLKKYGVLPAGT
jgi:transposase